MKFADFKSRVPTFKELQESPLVIEGEEVAFQYSVILESGKCLGTGFSLDKPTAMQIALSEALERQIVIDLSKLPERNEFLLDIYPSTCGFAVGTSVESTKARALSEAVERWLRSQWIDGKKKLAEISLCAYPIDKVTKYFVEQFKEVRVFVHKCPMEFAGALEFHSIIVVGFTDNGAFVGSKTVMNESAPILPALVEAWRHLEISKMKGVETDESKVIKYYARNKDSAISQIEAAKDLLAQRPKLRLIKEVSVGISGVYCFRALCEDFMGWHGANVERFVY